MRSKIQDGQTTRQREKTKQDKRREAERERLAELAQRIRAKTVRAEKPANMDALIREANDKVPTINYYNKKSRK